MSTINFKGKSTVWNHHLSVPYQTLEKVSKLSLKGEGEDENLIIEGDNLTALKSLLPKYQGKVKCIYIDPPYNTGNEGWVYNDNVNNPLIKDWIGKVVGKEGEDLTRHDKWLCMMTPRLKLLRELLADDGAIFISIDDNEQHYLRVLMDDVFGEENFIEQIVVQTNPRGSQASVHFANTHEYILVYSKKNNELDMNGLQKNGDETSEYNLTDENNKKYRLLGLRQRGGAWRREDRPNMFYPIFVNPLNGAISLIQDEVYSVEVLPKRPTGEEGRWTWATPRTNTFSNLLVGKKINRTGALDTWDIFRKDYLELENGEEKQTKIKSIWTETTMNYQEGRSSVKELFKKLDVFDYPKPVELVKRCIVSIANDEDIILDSFAGSGTTAQAVLELNKEGGNRKFILVQIPEEIKEGTPAYNAGYKNVQQITQTRVKKVIERDELKTGFTYYKLGKQIDVDSLLSGDLPAYEEFAKYVYFLATGKNFPEKSKTKEKDYFVGENNQETIYLIYRNDMGALKEMALTLDIAKKISEKDNGKKIVYAPACFLDEEHLEKYNITFVGIPFNLFERK